MVKRFLLSPLALLAFLGFAPSLRSTGIEVSETDEEIRIATGELEAAVKKRGYVTGVAGGTFLDKKSGFRDAGFGLDIVDWILEPGSDEAYRDRLPGDLPYLFGNLYHGNTAKRAIEGPQICTRARELSPRVIQGKDFAAVEMSYRYHLAAPGKRTGSRWTQTLVFPSGKRYFISSDRIAAVNSSEAMFLRLDMPGHIKHQKGDTFSEVYLSYLGRIPAREFLENFAPDSRFFYRREEGKIPARFIRAYHLRDPKSGRDGPWLAGMTLDPAVVSEAWCHQRDYVCFIEEFGGRPVRPGGSFSAAFIVGFFDSIEEMNEVYDRHAGRRALAADAEGWRLLAETTPEEGLAARLEWFQDQKLGLLIHWGPYSQWGCIESWPLVEEDRWARPDDLLPWVERGKDLEGFRRDYRSLPRTFAPSRFDPRSWAAAARKAGMRYLVFTTKHHDGFSMFDTRLSEYRITAPDCPHSRSPRADVTRALFDGFRAEGMGIGAYFSKADWNSPDYWSPEAPAHTRSANYDTLKEPERWARFVRFVHGQVEELLSGYGPIDILWLDAGQVRPPREDLQMDRLAAMARERQPDLLIVDRTVGGKYENYRTPEQTVPEKPPGYVWESCITMGSQWSYKPGDRYKPARELIQLLVDVVSKGGNLLLNIGPEPTGELPQEALGRLGEMAEWMAVNSEAIHGTRAIAPYRVGRVAFTRRGRDLYAIRLAGDGEETLPARIELPPLEVELDPAAPARFLGAKEPLRIVKGPGGNAIEIPEAVQKAPPCRHAWVFKLRLLP